MEARYQDIVNLLDTYKIVCTSPGALSPNGSIASPVDMRNGDMRMVNGYMPHSKPGAKKKRSKSNGMVDMHNGHMVNGHRHNGKQKGRRKKRSSADMPPTLSPTASLSPPHCYDRTPPQLTVYSQNPNPHMVDACGEYPTMNGHMPHHNQQCMDTNAMIGAHGGATHISMHEHNRKSLSDGPDIGADIGAVASAHPVQGQSWRNSTHENEESVMQLATSQPNIPQLMHQAPSTHSLAATAVSTATSPQPTMSPAKASPYGSPHNGQMQMQQHPNSPYANGHMKGHINNHGRDMVKGHKSPSRRLSGNEARNMQKYATHNTQIPNHHNQSMMATSMMEKFPTPPSQHSQGGVPSADNTPSHMPPVPPYLEHFPTPSPESPGQWSSSSPQSADWSGSEGISSPPQIQSQYNHSPGKSIYL